MPTRNKNKRWRQLASKDIFNTRYFQLRVDKCELPDGRVMPNYFVIDFPDWVQVVAVNKKDELILVNQYRYPGEGAFLEFPGGSTHPDRNEDPRDAGARELREETGYVSKRWKYLGFHYPNPALLSNKCHAYLALDCRLDGELDLDPYEDLEVCTMTPKKFVAELKRSKKIHSLMLATLELARPYLKGL